MIFLRLIIVGLLGSAFALGPARAQVFDPPADQPRPVAVAVTARILDVSRIQENLGEAAANVELTLKWTDSRVAFDAIHQGKLQKEFYGRAATQELEKIWHPAAMLRNIVGTPRSDEYGLIIGSDGKVTLVRNLEATFRFTVDMDRFPFDDVLLPIELTSSRYPDRQVTFTYFARDSAAVTFNPNPRASSWRLTDLSFDPQDYVAWNGETRNLLVVQAEAVRRAGQVIIRIFVPFLMIMMSSLVVLWLPDTNYFGKGTMVFSSIIALVALTFTLESNFPGSMSMPTPVSAIITSGFIYLVTVLILNIFVMNPEAAWAKHYSFVAVEVRSIIKWSVPLLMALIWAWLIVQAML